MSPMRFSASSSGVFSFLEVARKRRTGSVSIEDFKLSGTMDAVVATVE